MALTCKNCGGTISLDIQQNQLVCDSCGVRQALSQISAEADNGIYRADDVSHSSLKAYRRALNMMTSATAESAYLLVAREFDAIGDVLNAAALATECRERAELVRTERLYNEALTAMHSADPSKLEEALHTFESLGNYKDAPMRCEECIPLLRTAQIQWAEQQRRTEMQRLREEKQQKRCEAKRRFLWKLTALFAAVAVILGVIGYVKVYSPSNITITLTPRASGYITEKYNGTLFTYEAHIRNNGWLDVRAVDGTVAFETDGEVFVDTAISFSNYASAVVRAHKSSTYTWELTVYSDNAVQMLSATDFEDVEVHINIQRITYTNGKTKTY